MTIAGDAKAPRGNGPIREALAACRRHARYVLLFSVLVNIAYLAPTLYMLQVYDRAVPSGSRATLAMLTLALVAALLTLTFLDQMRQRILAAASVRLDRIFSTRLLNRALAAPGGPSQARLNQTFRHFDQIRGAVTGPAALAAVDAPWIPIYILVCFMVHWIIGLVTLAGAVLLLALAVVNDRMTRDLFTKASEANARSSGAQDAAGASADVIRSLGMTGAFVRRLESYRAAATRPQLEAARENGRVGGAIRFFRLFLQSLALGVGAWLAINKLVSAGDVFACSMLAGRALAPIDLLVSQWRSVATASAAYRAIEEQLADPGKAASTTLLPPPAPQLALERVSVLTPRRDRYILRDVSLAADGGSVVCLIGPSGAGKTTLLQVIANARAADAGEARIDGARYQDWDADRLGAWIGYVPQDCVLFPGTVKDNISRFRAWAGEDQAAVDARAVDAAQAADVHRMILALPEGYDTQIGPRGRGLSAGQQQRIALARAFYGAPTLFALDEPNSNLDAEGEASLVRAIAGLKARGALVIMAAHRTALVQAADYLAVVREGRIERYGPTAEILKAIQGAAAPVSGA